MAKNKYNVDAGFEPAETEIVETVEAPVVEAPVAKAKAGVYLAVDGDTYAALGVRLAPKGKSGFEYATELVEKNNGKALIEGTEVIL